MTPSGQSGGPPFSKLSRGAHSTDSIACQSVIVFWISCLAGHGSSFIVFHGHGFYDLSANVNKKTLLVLRNRLCPSIVYWSASSTHGHTPNPTNDPRWSG